MTYTEVGFEDHFPPYMGDIARTYETHLISEICTKRSQIIVTAERSNSEAREILANLRPSLVTETERKLSEKVEELQKRIECLKHLLDQPLISDTVRESVEFRIEYLEKSKSLASSQVFTLSSRIIYTEFSPVHRILQSVYFARYSEGEIYWRSVDVYIVQTPFNAEEIFTSQPFRSFKRVVGFSPNSLSHFSNCPLPPIVSTELNCFTQSSYFNMLMKGCFTSYPRKMKELKSYLGHTIWRILKRLSIGVLEHYEKPQRIYPEELSGYCAKYMNFSMKTQNMPNKPCQFYSSFTDIFQKATLQKHLFVSITCGFSLNYIKRNRNFPCGEMN